MIGNIIMKISNSIEQLLNEQVRNEYESAYLYLGMGVYLMSTPYVGLAKWMQLQAQEEINHGNKILEYLGDRSSKIQLLPIAAPTVEYNTPLEAFHAALEHEKKVTSWIYDIYNQAINDKDYTTQNFLNWFITEQQEEEAQTQHFVDRLQLAGDDKSALLLIDQEAAQRTE